LVSDIPAGDGKIANLLLQCTVGGKYSTYDLQVAHLALHGLSVDLAHVPASVPWSHLPATRAELHSYFYVSRYTEQKSKAEYAFAFATLKIMKKLFF
jgi:hypothetical protein